MTYETLTHVRVSIQELSELTESLEKRVSTDAKRLRAMFSNSPFGISVWTEGGCFLEANKRFYDALEIEGGTVIDLPFPVSREDCQKLDTFNFIEYQVVYDWDKIKTKYPYIKATGKRTIRMTVSLVNVNGDRWFVIYSKDITDLLPIKE